MTTYCIFYKTKKGDLDTVPTMEKERRTNHGCYDLTSILESALNLCWMPFSHCNSRFQNKGTNAADTGPDAIPSEIYVADVHEENNLHGASKYKLSGVSRNHTFQTMETALNSSYQSSRVNNDSFETRCIPKTIILTYSDIDVSESSINCDNDGNQIRLQRSISSISCPSLFKNLSMNSSIYHAFDDFSQDIDINVSSATGDVVSSKKEKSPCLLLDSKDSLLSFDGSSKSQVSSDLLDLLSFSSEDKHVNSRTDLTYLCEESVQTSYYSGRFDESLSHAISKGA